MARILLVNPPFYRLLGSHYNANSLGIAYVAAVLNQRGHDAWLYNADYLDKRLYPKLNALFDSFHDYKAYFADHDHAIWDEVATTILAFEPEWVGYTSYTANITAIDIISRRVRARGPEIRQVIGGVHATLDQQILDRLPAIDYAIRREGEYAMARLVEDVEPEQISGLGWRTKWGLRSNGDAEVIKNIDCLPFAERDKFWPLSEDQRRTVDVSYICTIRGCPYRCNYCASPAHWKRDKTQYRSPQSVLAEMEFLKSHYWDVDREFDFSASANAAPKSDLVICDNTMVYFVDDVFTVKKPRVKEILLGIIRHDLRMPWKCEARTDHLDPEICELLKQAGCVRVKLGFESGSDRILTRIQKDETREDMARGARMLHDAGVPFTAYFMAGFPGETDDDLRETIRFAREIRADYYSLSILAPYYGTTIYRNLVESGFELDKQPWEYFFHQTGELMVNTTLSPAVLSEYLSLNEMNPKSAGYV